MGLVKAITGATGMVLAISGKSLFTVMPCLLMF